MAYDGDGNRIFQLNYNLHTDDDWKGNSGNGNGNNKDNSGSGNSGNTSGETGTGSSTGDSSNNGNSNSGNNGNGSSTGTTESSESDTTTNTSTGTANDNNGNAAGNTNNTGGSQNQSGILFPIDGEVSELESELIGMIKTTGKEKNYELIEYVNDVNREHTEVLQELNINGIMDTSYTYGNERLTNERFTGEAAYYTYDPRGSVSGLTDSEGMLHQSYRYDPFGGIDFGKPQYNNVYAYNAESYNGNTEHQYLRARYYDTDTADFITEDSYLGKLTDPLTLNRYNYVKSSPLNYIDPSGHVTTEEGNDAHLVLQIFLTLVFGWQIRMEYMVFNHPNNPSGIGFADIVFIRPDTVLEVYEIKPASYTSGKKADEADDQRSGYISGLTTSGHKVDPVGTSLNLIINGLVLPSLINPNTYIRYFTREEAPGMIYYDYNDGRGEEMEVVLSRAEEKAESLICERLEPATVYSIAEMLNIDLSTVSWDDFIAFGLAFTIVALLAFAVAFYGAGVLAALAFA